MARWAHTHKIPLRPRGGGSHDTALRAAEQAVRIPAVLRQIWGLLDVLPDTFDKLPETLDTASKKDIVSRIERPVTQRERVGRMAADTDPE